MASPDRWRDPNPGDWLVILDRWDIEAGPWDLYAELCEWPNKYIEHLQQVVWVIPEPEWMLMVLRWPELRERGYKQ